MGKDLQLRFQNFYISFIFVYLQYNHICISWFMKAFYGLGNSPRSGTKTCKDAFIRPKGKHQFTWRDHLVIPSGKSGKWTIILPFSSPLVFVQSFVLAYMNNPRRKATSKCLFSNLGLDMFTSSFLPNVSFESCAWHCMYSQCVYLKLCQPGQDLSTYLLGELK